MAAKLQNIDISLKTIVLNIKDGSYAIPSFQRDFVWKTSDIRDLGDSIIRAYPISSLLMMSSQGSLKLKSTNLNNGNNLKLNDNYQYVLDGQQRITAISKIFLDYDQNKRYYFDLLSILNERFPDDNLKRFIKSNTPKFTESFCKEFLIGKSKDENSSKHNFRFISGKSIIEGRFGSVIRNFVNTLLDIDDEKIGLYTDHLSELLGALPSYGVANTIIASDADLGVICRVFEKVNSTGIKLTTFDLINAKSFDAQDKNFEDGLGEYLTNDILDFIEKNTQYSRGIKNFLDYNEERNKFSNLVRITRIIAIYELIKVNKYPAITNHQMLLKKSELWFETWNEKKNVFFDFMIWLEKEKIVNLLPNSYFEYIGGMVLSNPNILNNIFLKKYIKKYGLYLVIKGDSFSNSEIDKIEELIEIAKTLDNIKSLDKYTKIPPIILENKDMEDFRKGKLKYNAALYIMFNEKSQGKFTTDLLDYPIKDLKDFDEHHIIPKSFNKGKGNIYDSIANITLLNKESNRIEIKDLPFDFYISEIKKNLSEEKFKSLCELNLIPTKYNDQDDFLNQRQNLIVDYLKKYFE